MSVASILVIVSILLIDGSLAALVGLAAIGAGGQILRALRMKDEPFRWRLLLSAGLGTGALALAVQLAGLAGWLHRPLWIGLVGVLSAMGLFTIGRELRGRALDTPTGSSSERGFGWLWLVVVPYLALAVAAATCPPGYLWPAEGNGYDVLEYHFAAPKEWWVAGRIEYLPHNLYANFPFNAEMLYLLAFVLHGSPLAGVETAQLLNLALALLAVAAAWLAGREVSRGAGVLAGVVVASCPLVTCLCGVAYVENGLLAMTMLVVACLVRAGHIGADAQPRWALVGGLLAGLACGFKYTAIPLEVAPAAVAWTLFSRQRLRCLGLFAVGAALTVSPWLIRNAAWTGNPIFPLARGVFHERPGIWSDETAARWQEGHRPDPAERSARARIVAVWRKVVANDLYGAGLFALAAIGSIRAMRRRSDSIARRAVSLSLLLLFGGLAGWAATTHLVDRFAYPLIAPAAVLAAATWPDGAGRTTRGAVVGLVLASAAWNLRTLGRQFAEVGVFQVAAFGRMDWIRSGEWPGNEYVPRLNGIMAAGGKPLLVGEARTFYLDGRPDYCVVFNRNPLADTLRGRDPRQALRPWLVEQGYTHVYVAWSEIRRLANSRYGFWPELRDLGPADYEAAGLQTQEVFRLNGRRYATLYRVEALPGGESAGAK